MSVELATTIKTQLQKRAIPVVDPDSKPFVLEGVLDKIFNLEVLETLLSQSAFYIPEHKMHQHRQLCNRRGAEDTRNSSRAERGTESRHLHRE